MSRVSEYAALAIAMHGLALVVVNMTTTPKDDEALGRFSKLVVHAYRAIEIWAGIWGPKVKR